MSGKMAWHGAAVRGIARQSDGSDIDDATLREVHLPARRGERRVLRGTWTMTPEGLRLRWVAE